MHQSLTTSLVYRFDNLNCVDTFKNWFIQSITNSMKLNSSMDLSLLHEFVNVSQVNRCRIDAFNFINGKSWSQMLKTSSAFKNIQLLLGPDLAIQRKINLSIHMPNDKTAVLPIHSDSDSGDTPFQLNLWIPLTDCRGSNSMQIYPLEETYKYYDSFASGHINKNLQYNQDYSINIDYGSYLLFPPCILHGNVENTSPYTRISLNVRIRSLLSPDLPEVPPDRSFLSYYQPWFKSSLYQLSERVYRALSV